MVVRTCPVCGTVFAVYPNKVRAVNCCSPQCLGVRRADAEDDLARFDPGPATGKHDGWIDAWRAERVALEAAT